MSTFFQDPYVVVNISLLILLFVLLFTCFSDGLWKTSLPCRWFVIWGLGGILGIGLDVVDLWLGWNAGYEETPAFGWFLYINLETWESIGMSLCVMTIIGEKKAARRGIVFSIVFAMALAGIAGALIPLSLADPAFWFERLSLVRNLTVGIGLSLYVLIESQHIGKEDTLLLLMTILLPLLTYLVPGDIQYVYTKLVVCLMFFVIYLSMWKVKKEDYAKQTLELAQKDAELASQKAELAKKEMELTNNKVALMMSQIQPHFLYNTLSSIARLCTENPVKARQVAMDFSAYFRENLQSLNSDEPIPFKQELEHTETYLNIELARFPDKLHVEYNICAEEFYIPALTLQPLVENAVKHGICRKEGEGTLIIETYELEDAFEILVRDDGVGFVLSEQSGEEMGHIGINSVRQRLMSQCQGALIFKSQPGKGTAVTIYLPKEGVNG